MECWCASQVGLRQKIISINQTLTSQRLQPLDNKNYTKSGFSPIIQWSTSGNGSGKQKRYSKRNIDAQTMLDWGKRSIQ
ncbi:MAG: hypothetical protein IPN72_10345 [Saprospiraceae bacterium]|nr:hypothetical protein [Saprospiraceae bacterium]